MEKAQKKILIIKLSSLGDVIFTVPLANTLKNNGYEVSWLVSEKGIDVVKNNTCVDKVFFAPLDKWKKSKNLFQNLIECFQLIRQIRQENFDIALDAQMRIKSLPYLAYSGAKRRIIAKDFKEFSALGANEFAPKLKDGFEKHAVEGYLYFAKYLGIEKNEICVSLPESSDETKKVVDTLLKDVDNSKPIIAIAPATTWVGKHWNKGNWKILIQKLEQSYNIIFTGTAKDIDLINDISSNKHLNLAGKTNLPTLIELLNRVDLLISLDSGTTHLGWATQKPKIVSIFCCTPKTLYAPYGNSDKYIALQSKNCTPCHHKKCKNKNNKYCCTTSPNVNEVLEAVNILLEREIKKC